MGQTVNFAKRFKEHITCLRGGYRDNLYFQRAWDKYGEQAFSFWILEGNVSVDKLTEREQFWVDHYGISNLYNTGECVDAPMRGRKQTEKVKQILSKKAKERYSNPEFAKKMLKARNEYLKKGNANPMKGRKHTNESKQKMSEARKAYFVNNGHPCCIPIVQLSKDGDFIAKHKSMADAARKLGCHSETIRVAVSPKYTKHHTAKGFKWVYAKDYYKENKLCR